MRDGADNGPEVDEILADAAGALWITGCGDNEGVTEAGLDCERKEWHRFTGMNVP